MCSQGSKSKVPICSGKEAIRWVFLNAVGGLFSVILPTDKLGKTEA